MLTVVLLVGKAAYIRPIWQLTRLTLADEQTPGKPHQSG
jgi:hypothetical protein